MSLERKPEPTFWAGVSLQVVIQDYISDAIKSTDAVKNQQGVGHPDKPHFDVYQFKLCGRLQYSFQGNWCQSFGKIAVS